MARIIAFNGSLGYYGSEKANIQVLKSLKSQGHQILILINKDLPRDSGIVNALQEISLDFRFVGYYHMFFKKDDFKTIFHKISKMVAGNISLIREVIRFKPQFFYTSKSEYFFNFSPIFLLSSITLIYRIGDEPEIHHPFHKFVWRLIAWRVDKFVAVSNFIASSLQRTAGSNLSVDVIYSFYETNIIPAQRLINVDEVRLLYVGQITAKKGLHVLLESLLTLKVNDLSNFRLDIVGFKQHGSDEYHEQIVSLSNRLKRNVFLHDYTTNVQEFYAQCDLHVCPSIYQEPLANVIIEAKLHGKPSVVFKVGGLHEIIRDGSDGYVVDNIKSDSLAETLSSVLKQPSLLEPMGDRARESIEELGINNYHSLWKKVLND